MTTKIITIYHKTFNSTTKLEQWTRYNYDAWYFGGKGSSINKGYDNANDINVRIMYKSNKDLNIDLFKIGDIIVPDNIALNINKQQDLNNYNVYNITSINNNNFGINKHIHLGGK